MKCKITQVARDSAVVEPIVLRDGSQTRMVFKAQIVNNKNDQSKPVRGHVLWQRRKKAEQGQPWTDECHLALTQMEAGSGLKLELSTDELYILTLAVRGLYGVYWKHGRQLPKTGEEFELADYAQAAKSLDALENVAQIVGAVGTEGAVSILKWLTRHDNAANVLDALPKLDLADLAGINSLAGIGILRQALSIWEANKVNPDEGFWQTTLAQYSFVFSQVFSTPMVVLGTKAYVGGKCLEGIGGKQPDFLLTNELTRHVLIVEIKTPMAALLHKSAYRAPDVFAVSREVCGAVAQVAWYKDELLKNYANLARKSEDTGMFRAADPRCLVVVGSTEQLDNGARKDSFEHFRQGQRGTEIITFDELFSKVQMLLALLEGNT